MYVVIHNNEYDHGNFNMKSQTYFVYIRKPWPLGQTDGQSILAPLQKKL